MTDFIAHLSSRVATHAGLAYFAVFFVALLEAVPVFGSLIPGSTIILAMSALIGGGELKLLSVMLAAIVGAVIGDGSAFWIGHRSEREILGVWPMSRYPGVVAQSKTFFDRYGTLAVFLARFVAPVRAFVPLTAGALGMSPLLFYTVNIPAILLWASAHVLPGALAISALHHYGGLPHHFGKLIWIAAVIVIAAIIGTATWWCYRGRGFNVSATVNKRTG